jgi:threonine/homoserine/homoserine lactone efflux protein
MTLVTPDAQSLWLFTIAALALLLVPGPAVLYIVARSIEQGRLAGLVSILGIHTATLVHVLAASLGLSAVLASSAIAFGIVKYAGAAYLIWIGLKKLLSRPAEPSPAAFANHKLSRLFRDGFIVNLLNPKTALFFFAFLPQFIDVERGHAAMQMAILGLIFTVLGFVTDSCYSLAASTAGRFLRGSASYLRAERYVSGTIMIGLGVTAAFAGNPRK